MIEIWQVGNTGVRNPMRIQEAFRLYAESNLVGKLRGVSGAVAFTNYLCERGILNNAPGKDPTGSYGRKWRLVFNKNGFTYDVAKEGLPQADIGPVDGITPFGKAFLKAGTVPAVQECFLRASAMHMEQMPDGGSFSPLRWTLAVMLEIERRTGSSGIGFAEFAAYVQTSNPTTCPEDVASEILSMRTRRARASSKRKFDKALFGQMGRDYAKKAENFAEYGDMNLRYLRATGVVRAQGKGIAIVDEKHDLVELLASVQRSNTTLQIRLRELYDGPSLPTDDLQMANRVLQGLEERLRKRGIAFEINYEQFETAVDVNNARHRLEALLGNDEEIVYARTQKQKWSEIADYMSLVMKHGGVKQYDDDTEIKVPKDEVSAYLEWTVWRAFLAMNTLSNKPYEIRRFKVDQDFFPVGTAPGNGPDMIAEYEGCKVVIEVTMSDNSRQEAMEGEPVRRHVFDSMAEGGKPVFGLFIANHVNTNTVETFRVGTWYGKNDVRTRLNIVPLTLRQFKDYFVSMFTHGVHRNGEIVELLEGCVSKRDLGYAPDWKTCIEMDVVSSIQAKARQSRIVREVVESLRFKEYLPYYSLRAACGYFGDGESVECEGWVKVEGCGKLNEEMFVVQASGLSMEPKIHDGDLCVMRARPQGSRVGMIVLAQHHETADPDTGGAYSIKKYTSEKVFDEDGSWRHEKITLLPLNPDYAPIEMGEGDSIVAALVKVL